MDPIVFDDEHLRVIHQPGSGDYLLVTFNEMGMKANGTEFWGRKLGEKLGIPVLGFVSKEPNWFPSTSVNAAIDAVRDILDGHDDIVTYGHSMGGYAALRYANALRAATAVSFCPQFSINPADLVDTRFNRYYRDELQGRMGISRNNLYRRGYVFYDPWARIDRPHVERITKVLPGVTLLPAHLTGHSTVRMLTNSGAAQTLLDLCRKDDLRRLKAFVATQKRAHPERPQNFIRNSGKTRIAAAANLYRRENERFNPKQRADLLLHIANLQLKVNAVDAAEQSLLEALEHMHEYAPVLRLMGVVKSRLKQPHEAIQWVERALAASPNDSHTHARMSLLQGEVGNYPAAEAAIARALEINASFPGFAKQMSVVKDKLGDPDGALEWAETYLSLAPHDAHAHAHLGEIRLKRGEREEARRHYEEAVRRDPANARFKTHLASIA